MLIDDLYCGDFFKNLSEAKIMIDTDLDDAVSTNVECSTCPCDNENYLYDHIEDLEDIDPSLFCPDIIMELGDTPIEITNDSPPNDFDKNNGSLHPIDGQSVVNNEINEENLLSRKLYGAENSVPNTKIHCTSCNKHLGSALSNHKNLRVHPLLQVLVCKDCYDFYTSGEFETDEDGSEKYCRWCGQGGRVICCSSCQFVFCDKCIRRNLGKKELADIRNNDNWTCFKCDWSQLSNLRVHCAEVVDYMDRGRSPSTISNQKELDKDYSRCCGMNNATTTPSSSRVRKRKRRSSDDENDLDYNPLEDEYFRSTSPVKKTQYTTTNIPLTLKPSLIPLQNNPMQILSRNGMLDRYCTKTPNKTLTSQSNPLLTSSGFCGQSDSPNKRKEHRQNPLAKFKPIRLSPSAQSHSSNGVGDKRKEKEVYEKVISLAGRISSDLSSSLTKLSRNKSNASTLEDTVSIHNQFQDVLNGTIESLLDLRKLSERKPISAKRIVAVQPRPSGEECVSNIVRGYVNTDSLLRSKNSLLQSNHNQIGRHPVAAVDKGALQKNISKNVNHRGTN